VEEFHWDIASRIMENFNPVEKDLNCDTSLIMSLHYNFEVEERQKEEKLLFNCSLAHYVYIIYPR